MNSLKKHLLPLVVLAGFSASALATCPSLLDHDFKRLSGKAENLCRYQGKVILVVNTASRCGFTQQFESLQKIHDEYRAKGFVILGFPSSDFNQELADNRQVADFCQLNYGVRFPMYEISAVSGARANTFYQSLTRISGQAPRWNFHKYLIARDGQTVLPMESRIEPDSREMRTKIEAMLAQ